MAQVMMTDQWCIRALHMSPHTQIMSYNLCVVVHWHVGMPPDNHVWLWGPYVLNSGETIIGLQTFFYTGHG
jgi:hypothetical protein